MDSCITYYITCFSLPLTVQGFPPDFLHLGTAPMSHQAKLVKTEGESKRMERKLIIVNLIFSACGTEIDWGCDAEPHFSKTQNTKQNQGCTSLNYLPRYLGCVGAMAMDRTPNSPLSRTVETFSAHPDIPLIICRRAKRTCLLKKIQLLFWPLAGWSSIILTLNLPRIFGWILRWRAEPHN